jgi:hypothetical protein
MQCSTVTGYTKTDWRIPLLWDMTSRQCVIGSRRFEGTTSLWNADYPVTRCHIPQKNDVVNHITAKTSRLTKIHYFNINCTLVHNLFADAVLTAAVIYRLLRAQTDTCHEVGRMVKVGTERNFEDPDLEFSCSDWVRARTAIASPDSLSGTFQYKIEVLLLRKSLCFNHN